MELALFDKSPKLAGHWRLDIYKGDDRTPENFLQTIEGDNIVTTNGKGLIMDMLFGLASATKVSAMGVGATAAAAVVGDTQLGSTPTIKVFDALPTRSGLVVTCVTTFATSDANISWNELGMFNGTVNGTSVMLNRIAPIGPFTKTSALSIVVTVTLTQA